MKTDYRFENFGFNLCRICFKPEGPETSLFSLFDKGGAKAEMLQLVAGINVLEDEGKYKALICGKCSRKLDNAFEIRRLARNAENNYFQLLRDDQHSEVKFVKSDEETAKPSNLPSNICHNPTSLIKCWRCSLKKIISILPQKNQTQGKDSDLSKNLPEVVFSALKSQGCTNSLKEIESDTKLEIKFPVVMLDRIKLPQIEKEPIISKDFQDSKISQKDKPSAKTFSCRICKKNLKHRTSLRNHIATMHFNVKRYYCDLCEGKFFYKRNLIAHFENHIKNPDYGRAERVSKFKFKCHRCLKRFTSLQGLKRHNIVHSITRPWKCVECKQCFKKKITLKIHQLNVHELNH